MKRLKDVSGTTREKIKYFVNQIDDNKTNKLPFNQNQIDKNIKIPVYDYASNIADKKYESCFKQKSFIKISNKDKDKDDSNSLKEFIDFNNNPNKEKKLGFNLEPLNSLSSNNILAFNNNINNTSHVNGSQRNKIDNHCIQLSDIIAISNKIRFCSNQEMKNMDKGLVDELINLGLVIQKTIVHKMKSKEYNCL